MFSACLWISITLLFQYSGSCLSTLHGILPVHSVLMVSCHCSCPLFLLLLYVPLVSFAESSPSPQCSYDLLQSMHRTSYITPFFSNCGLGFFTFISASRRVLWDLNTALTPICLQIRCMCVCALMFVAHMGGKSLSGSGFSVALCWVQRSSSDVIVLTSRTVDH